MIWCDDFYLLEKSNDYHKTSNTLFYTKLIHISFLIISTTRLEKNICLDIVEAKLRAPLEPLNTSVVIIREVSGGALNSDPRLPREDYTKRNVFEILLNQPWIRLYLPFSDWFRSKRTSVWIKINRKMVNTIWFRVDLIRFRKYLSACTRKCALFCFTLCYSYG